jgi:hypothetical protein
MATPLSLVHGGTNTSENSPQSRHLLFQSQFNPQPPAISSGRPGFMRCWAKRKNRSNIASEICQAMSLTSCDSTPRSQKGLSPMAILGVGPTDRLC